MDTMEAQVLRGEQAARQMSLYRTVKLLSFLCASKTFARQSLKGHTHLEVTSPGIESAHGVNRSTVRPLDHWSLIPEGVLPHIPHAEAALAG